jgi:hypothetical protein
MALRGLIVLAVTLGACVAEPRQAGDSTARAAATDSSGGRDKGIADLRVAVTSARAGRPEGGGR